MNETTKLIAVDAPGFLHTVNWPEMSTPQQQNALIQQLINQRPAWKLLTQKTQLIKTLPNLAIPALVDAHTWEALQLTPLSDRQAIMQNLENDPLNLELIGNLVLGVIASLLLTWLGCLIASWMNANQRSLSFGILWALGSTP